MSATPRPWHWQYEDASLQSLCGADLITDHVLSVSPCESCQVRAEETIKAGRGLCLGPTAANAEFILRAVNTHDDLLAALKALTYPDGHIWHGGNAECTGECQAVRAAIALAEDREP